MSDTSVQRCTLPIQMFWHCSIVPHSLGAGLVHINSHIDRQAISQIDRYNIQTVHAKDPARLLAALPRKMHGLAACLYLYTVRAKCQWDICIVSYISRAFRAFRLQQPRAALRWRTSRVCVFHLDVPVRIRITVGFWVNVLVLIRFGVCVSIGIFVSVCLSIFVFVFVF